MRITEPEAWEPDNLANTPFDLPEDCDPRPENIWTLYSEDYCGWECRNNAYLMSVAAAGFDQGGALDTGAQYSEGGGGGVMLAYMPEDEGGRCAMGRNPYWAYEEQPRKPLVLGMPDATYGPGSERLGIGWRSV